MAQLTLQNMEFYAFHGHHPEEQVIGGKYSIDLTFEANTDQAEITDDLSDTVDYSNMVKLTRLVIYDSKIIKMVIYVLDS